MPNHTTHQQAIADQIAHDIATVGNIPAIAYAIATVDGVQVASAVGQADLASGRLCTAQDQFPWFSMTKIATATAAMRLHEAGALDLDAPIGKALASDEQLLPVVTRENGTPTLRQLLTHTAGLANPLPVRWVRLADAPPDEEAVTRLLAKHGRPKRAPGGRAAYSNISYLLAGRVLEASTGAPVQDLLRELVLAPAGMHDTDFTYDRDLPRAVGYLRAPRPAVWLLRSLLPAGVVGGRVGGYAAFEPFLVTGPAYGGLVGTVADAAKLAAAHLPLREGTPAASAARLLSPASLTEMQRITHPGKPFDHGVGWFRKPTDADRKPAFVEHYGTGGGFWNAIRLYPDLGVAMVAMANTTIAWNVDDLFTRLAGLTWT